MALKFTCPHCGAVVISKFLNIGEVARCRACGADVTVPTNAAITTDDEYAHWLAGSVRPAAGPAQPQPAAPDAPSAPPLPTRAQLIGSVHDRSVFDYIALGWESLTPHLGLAVGGLLVYAVISICGQIIPFLNFLFGFLVAPALSGGFTMLFLNITGNNNPKIDNLMDGFQRYGTMMGIFFIMMAAAAILATFFFVTIASMSAGSAIGMDAFDNPEFARHIFRHPLFFVGFAMFAIGFALVSVLFVLVYPLAMDNPKIGAINSLVYSVKIVWLHYWTFLGYYIVAGLLVVVSAFFLFFPLLFTIPLFNIGLMRLYFDARADFEQKYGPLPALPQPAAYPPTSA